MSIPEYARSLTSPRVGPNPRSLLGSGDVIWSIPTKVRGVGEKDPDHARERKHRSHLGVGFFVVCPVLLSVCFLWPLAL
jgi:hypothetical protein